MKSLFLYITLLLSIATTAEAEVFNPGRQLRSGRGGGATLSTKSDASSSSATVNRVIEPSYAWQIDMPLGQTSPATIDTLMLNYAQRLVPSLAFGPASAITGNYGCAGIDMIYFTRPEVPLFMFDGPLRPYLPDVKRQIFYNTRIPMTLLGYETGGGKQVGQDHLHAIFSGNINRQAQVGAFLSYPYSRGYYENQSMKDFSWGLNGSYMGDHYEMQAAFAQFNSLNKENGGITDDEYILDPEGVQGGAAHVSSRNIPVNLSGATNRVRGLQLMVNNRYKLGFHRVEMDSVKTDSVVKRIFVPVTAFAWTFNFRNGAHTFRDGSRADEKYWENTYLTPGTTLDRTKYWTVDNTVGVSLLEGFNKWAKFGLSAFLHHQVTKYVQTADTISNPDPDLTPFPFDHRLAPSNTEHRLYVGARLEKRLGSLLTYNAEGEFGLIGKTAADLRLSGDVSTKFRLRSDSVKVTAYGQFSNLLPSFFLREYLSNHFVWSNDFGKTRRVRLGGCLDIAHTGTTLSAGVENVQNLVYFNSKALPVQHTGNLQIISATLKQQLGFKAWHWDNDITWQTVTGASDVLRLPALSIYSNMYLQFKIATLYMQLGVDCQYYTRYKALAYQPATMSFYNQDEGIKVGNYPLCNAYANMKLSKVRFFVMFSHVNEGLFGGTDYFSTAHNPLNPRRLQFGLTVDFAN